MKYVVDQSFMNSPSFIVFHCYLREDVDVAYYTTINALFNADIKTLQSHCNCYENDLFQPVKVKDDGSYLYRAVATNIILCFLIDVWTGRFPPWKKPGIKLATHEVVNDLKQFVFQKQKTLNKKI